MPDVELMFRAASAWGVAIKNGLGRPDFHIGPLLLRMGLLENGLAQPRDPSGGQAILVVPWLERLCSGRRLVPAVSAFLL